MWKQAGTVLLFKKNHHEANIVNYRSISLLSVVYKTFTKILLNRMERTLDDYQPVEQVGFSDNFTCLDNIQAVTQTRKGVANTISLLFVASVTSTP